MLRIFFFYFGRINYDYQGKYLLKASIRKDGSSRFGKSKQIWCFSTFSLDWVISKEEFLSSSNVILYLKLRASWGETGNENRGFCIQRFGMQTLINNYQL